MSKRRFLRALCFCGLCVGSILLIVLMIAHVALDDSDSRSLWYCEPIATIRKHEAFRTVVDWIAPRHDLDSSKEMRQHPSDPSVFDEN